jgi:hypothetical protein
MSTKPGENDRKKVQQFTVRHSTLLPFITLFLRTACASTFDGATHPELTGPLFWLCVLSTLSDFDECTWLRKGLVGE